MAPLIVDNSNAVFSLWCDFKNTQESCDEHAVQQPQPQRPLGRPANIAISLDASGNKQELSHKNHCCDVYTAHEVTETHEVPQPQSWFMCGEIFLIVLSNKTTILKN
jgi:hypothetical protein